MVGGRQGAGHGEEVGEGEIAACLVHCPEQCTWHIVRAQGYLLNDYNTCLLSTYCVLGSEPSNDM